MKTIHKQLMLATIILAVAWVIVSIAQSASSQTLIEQYELAEKLNAGQLDGLRVTLVVREDGQGLNRFEWEVSGKKYYTKVTEDQTKELTVVMREHGVQLQNREMTKPTSIGEIILALLPVALIIFVLFFVMRQIQIGGGKAMSFGKSRARMVADGHTKVTFKDVAGVEEAKEELSEIVDFLKDPKKYTRLGGKIPKGVLLMGSPGTGKTLLAKAIAGEAGVPFFSISGSDFVEMFVGVGASRVRDLFEQCKKHAPCIVFVDEIDAVGRHRGAGLGGGHDEREQTLNQLLVEMDGFEANEGIIVIAATNRPDVLDPALLRPGRFDRRVTVPLPDIRGRESILTVHTRKVPLSEEVDLSVVARGTPGFAGADLSNLVNEAALIAAKQNQSKVTHLDFDNARDKVLMGSERRSAIFSKEELRNTAVHEAGHALVSSMTEHNDPVHKVTIIPRGRALGVTQKLPTEDRYNVTRDQALDEICMAFGGRIAELRRGGVLNTGASNDLQQATQRARAMVMQWGMSETLGPVTFSQQDQNSVFLGREIAKPNEYSEATAEAIDAEVRKILEAQYKRAEEIIDANLDKLDALTEALLEYETLEAVDVQTILRGESLQKAPPKKRMKTREELVENAQDNASAGIGAEAVLGGLLGSKA